MFVLYTHHFQRERPRLIFEDPTEPTELRIASYQTIMQCAKISDIHRLQRVLVSETSVQVLSFVFTHLVNLRETNTNFKEHIDELVRNVDFASKDLGRLQLSRNFAGLLNLHFIRVVFYFKTMANNEGCHA